MNNLRQASPYVKEQAETERPLDISGSFGSKVKDYKLLVKLRLNLTVVFSSVVAYLIAVQGAVNPVALIILALGGFLVTGAANALNQVLEKDYDRMMKRTADRPLASGRMKTSEAVMSAGFMSLIGISLLALFNPWTAFLGTFALVSYAFVYTPMKRVSPDAVTIGAVPGALPTLIGCTAAQGELTWFGVVLFGMQFLWQFPHFWSIGYLGYEDYQRAGYQLVPQKNGQPAWARVGLQALAASLALIPLGILPYYLGYSGWVSLILAGILAAGYAVFAWRFYRMPARKTALGLMFYSFGYMPFTLLAFWLDKLG